MLIAFGTLQRRAIGARALGDPTFWTRFGTSAPGRVL